MKTATGNFSKVSENYLSKSYFLIKLQLAGQQTTMNHLRETFQKLIQIVLLDTMGKKKSEYFLTVVPEHCWRWHWMIFGNNSFFVKFEIKQYTRTFRFSLKLSRFYKHGESGNCIRSCAENSWNSFGFETKFDIHNQKEMKPIKNPDCNPFR